MYKKNAYLFFFKMCVAFTVAACLVGVRGSGTATAVTDARTVTYVNDENKNNFTTTSTATDNRRDNVSDEEDFDENDDTGVDEGGDNVNVTEFTDMPIPFPRSGFKSSGSYNHNTEDRRHNDNFSGRAKTGIIRVNSNYNNQSGAFMQQQYQEQELDYIPSDANYDNHQQQGGLGGPSGQKIAHIAEFDSSDDKTNKTYQKILEDKGQQYKEQQLLFQLAQRIDYKYLGILAAIIEIFGKPKNLSTLNDQIKAMRDEEFTTQSKEEEDDDSDSGDDDDDDKDGKKAKKAEARAHDLQIVIANQLTDEEWDDFFNRYHSPQFKKSATLLKNALKLEYSIKDIQGDKKTRDQPIEPARIVILSSTAYLEFMMSLGGILTNLGHDQYDLDANDGPQPKKDAEKVDAFNYEKIKDGDMKNMIKALSDTADLLQSYNSNSSTMVIIAMVITVIVAIGGFATWFWYSSNKKQAAAALGNQRRPVGQKDATKLKRTTRR